MRATIVLVCAVLAIATAGRYAPKLTWTPNSWESSLQSYSGPPGVGVFTVPLPPGLNQSYNLALLEFVLFNSDATKLCASALLSVEGAERQAVLTGLWGTFYMGSEYTFTEFDLSGSYDPTDRATQPCANVGGGGQQSVAWQVPAGSSVQFNISYIAYGSPPGVMALTTNWEIVLQLS